jgi:hypothetical protein
LVFVQAQLRRAVRKATPLHETGRTLLLRTFRQADDGGGGLDTGEFIAACAALGVVVSLPQAKAVFRAHATDEFGGLRYVRYADQLLKSASRQLSEQPVCVGYPVSDDDFRRKIVYPRCRTVRV